MDYLKTLPLACYPKHICDMRRPKAMNNNKISEMEHNTSCNMEMRHN